MTQIHRKEVVLARLCLGHTRVTHSFLVLGEEQPQCVGWLVGTLGMGTFKPIITFFRAKFIGP